MGKHATLPHIIFYSVFQLEILYFKSTTDNIVIFPFLLTSDIQKYLDKLFGFK